MIQVRSPNRAENRGICRVHSSPACGIAVKHGLHRAVKPSASGDFGGGKEALISARLERGRLCGGLSLLRLQPVQVIDGALRVSGGGEDRAVVVLQDLEPDGDVAKRDRRGPPA